LPRINAEEAASTPTVIPRLGVKTSPIGRFKGCGGVFRCGIGGYTRLRPMRIVSSGRKPLTCGFCLQRPRIAMRIRARTREQQSGD